MDEFFAFEEHQALEEPMVIHCANSSPVGADRKKARVIPMCRAWVSKPAANAPRFDRPYRTGPPLAA